MQVQIFKWQINFRLRQRDFFHCIQLFFILFYLFYHIYTYSFTVIAHQYTGLWVELSLHLHISCLGHDCVVVGFTSTYASIAYHH